MLIRQAQKSDAEELATLILMSAPRAIDSIFTLNDKLTAQRFLQSSLIHQEGQYGYLNHWVVADDQMLLGCLSSWRHNMPKSFLNATLSSLTNYYGPEEVLTVMSNSQVIQDYIPKPAPHELCIGHFAVAVEYRRRGAGSLLIETMTQQALIAKKSHLSLDVEAENQTALAFYLKLGFSKDAYFGVTPRMQALGIEAHIHLTKVL